jgi:hypothetical protein
VYKGEIFEKDEKKEAAENRFSRRDPNPPAARRDDRQDNRR